MNEPTVGELAREVARQERRLSDFVRAEVYERDVHELRDDIREIKEAQKWAMRLIAGQFVVLVLALLFYAIQNLP